MNLAERINDVEHRISDAERSCQRTPDSVELLAVSKSHTTEDIRQAFHAGLYQFGENYLQEAIAKIKSLTDLPLCWHFIGRIQGNKAQTIAQHFAWVHGVCRKKIAQILNDERPSSLPALNICIQVNMDHSDNKSGINPEFAAELAEYITHLPRLHLRGLMIIPEQKDEAQIYQDYVQTKNLLDTLNTRLNLSMDTLSMGMSNDLTIAIQAGSTMVRVGRAIFGERIKHEH